MPGKGGEVVTRQPYRKVWLDHLLSKETTLLCGRETGRGRPGNRSCLHRAVLPPAKLLRKQALACFRGSKISVCHGSPQPAI
jgi:hypothetical protein